MADEEDWRLVFVLHLKDVEFRFQPWASLTPEWDHDHCTACGVKIWNRPEIEGLSEGYATTESFAKGPLYEWLCADCFADLQPVMGWVAL